MYAWIITPCRQHGFIMAYKFTVLEWALFKPPCTSVSVYILSFEKNLTSLNWRPFMNVKPWMQSHECTATLCPLTPTQFFLNDAQWTLRVLVTQSCPTLRHPMDHSPPGSSVLGILQERHWSGLPFSSPGYLPNPGIKPKSPALQTDSLTYETPGKPDEHWIGNKWLTALSPAKRL